MALYFGYTGRLVKQEHHRQRSGLLKAFAHLSPNKSGYVDVRTWRRLLTALHPAISKHEQYRSQSSCHDEGVTDG